jgi:lipopolysaccharide/colanic/teichoic acid biosynthesis glycosyltransferase
MSIVGPRPQVQREVEAYDDLIGTRLFVRPGVTGLWQVSGRNDLSIEDSKRLDMSYVENWSMGLDVGICFRTAQVVLTGRGAY